MNFNKILILIIISSIGFSTISHCCYKSLYKTAKRVEQEDVAKGDYEEVLKVLRMREALGNPNLSTWSLNDRVRLGDIMIRLGESLKKTEPIDKK